MFKNFIKGYFNVNKPLLGLSITPEGMVEMAVFDGKSKTIVAYIREEMEFNPVKKMVDDSDALSAVIEGMLTKLNIAKGAQVVLNLPSFYFGLIDIDPATQVQEDILINIKSEVEQSYMFKQNVPVISVSPVKYNLSQRPKVAFCAAQKNLIKDIKITLNSLELQVLAIENSYSSMLKALQYYGVISEQIASDMNWGVVLINQNSYSILAFIGDNLVDVTEDAIAIKTYEKNEVNYAVASVINSGLQNFDFASVVIINNAVEVSVDILAQKIICDNLTTIENNGLQTETWFKVSPKVTSDGLAGKISWFVVGAAVSTQKNDFLSNFDLKGDEDEEPVEQDTFMGVPVDWNVENCTKLFILFAILIAIPIGSIYFALYTVNNTLQNQIAALNEETNKVNADIKKYEIPKEEVVTFDPYEEINNIVKSNNYSKLTYNALSVNTPKSTWLTYFYVNKDKATIIRGKSQNVNDVYTFFRDVKKSLNNKDLVLSSISVATERDNGKSLYDFEITNREYISIVELIKNNNKDYQAKIGEIKKEQTKKYESSYLPTYPVSDSSFTTGNANVPDAALSQQIQQLKELDQVGSNEPPAQLPPT